MRDPARKGAVACPAPVAVAVGVLLSLTALAVLAKPSKQPAISPSQHTDIHVHQVRQATLQEHAVIWELPVGGGPPVAALLALHGCSHSAGDFWPPSATCADCLGLPEEVLIRRAALRRAMVVVAVSSADRRSGCWDVRGAADSRALPKIVEAVLRREGLTELPVYALGASSGGAMALLLPREMPALRGVIAHIMAVPPSMLELPPGHRFPPALFVHMPRDERTAQGVAADLAALRAAGAAAEELCIRARPLTPQFLAFHAPASFSGENGSAVVDALREGGFLDADSLLLQDPRRTADAWRAALAPLLPSAAMAPDAAPLPELLNVAWAEHEIVSQHVSAALEWVLAGGARGIEELVAAAAQEP